MTARTPIPSYFVVMLDYPEQRAREAIVNPEVTRRELVARILTGDYDADRILFIHHVTPDGVENVTYDVMAECAREVVDA